MTPALKRLILVLGAITVLMLVILAKQIRTAHSITTKPVDLPLLSSNSVDIPITEEDQMFGNRGAKLTVVGFFDINNKLSRQYFLKIYDLVQKNPTKARFVWKFYPEKSLFRDTAIANQALYCAGKQNKFWSYAEKLAAEKRTIKDSRLIEVARELKLNQTLLETCIVSDESLNRVGNDYSLGQSLYLPEPPMVFVNNKLLNLDDTMDLTQLLTSLL